MCIYIKPNHITYFCIYVIIIISPLQSTAGHRPLQLLAIWFDLRLLASSSRQPSCANRHSTWPEGVLHYVYLDSVSTPELVYPSGCRFYGWYGQRRHFSMLIRCAMSVNLALCRISWFRIWSRRETPSIALSIARWATLNLWTSLAVSVHVSAPYIMVERTDWRLSSLAFVGSTVKRLDVVSQRTYLYLCIYIISSRLYILIGAEPSQLSWGSPLFTKF
jgi:hypothetical protein